MCDFACAENQHVFVRFAFDTFGFLAPETIGFLDRVQIVVHNNFSTPGNQGFVFARIGFAIRKGVAVQLVACLPAILLCPNLEVLSIKSCPNVTDESMIKLASGCPKLKELDISYCYEISHESLQALGRKCTNITVLKRNLMNWLDPSQHIGIVPTSYLNACPQDGDSEAAAIGNLMPQLLHLELRFSKLSARGLALISHGCKNLEYVDLSGCGNVTSRDIANSTEGLTNLKTIKKPNFYIPRSGPQAERYGHWRLYDDRFQTDAFRI